ncbi:MAG: hypothetical protein IE909_04600 [Campylobacterales bacterium]|nr:hypothetical protein [Campylobacterales bacterium]
MVFVLIFNLFYKLNESSVGQISQERFASKANERIEFLKEFFYPYEISAKAIESNQTFIKFISGENNNKTIL